jgi:RNA polymerase sigma-54 factor
MKQSLDVRLTQNLAMTPQLQQSIRLLQLSAIELSAEIQEALEANPLLEESAEDLNPSDTIAEPAPDQLGDGQDYLSPQELKLSGTTPNESGEEISNDWDDSEPQYSSISTNRGSLNGDGGNYEAANSVSAPVTLTEHLLWQMQMTSISSRDRDIAELLIRSINSEGYLTMSVEEISQMFPTERSVEESEIEAVLKLVQTFDPAGVGAQSLSDRIRILLCQLDPETEGIETAIELASNYLDILGRRELGKLKRVLGVSEEALSTAVKLVTALDPRISGSFDEAGTRYIVPDVIAKKTRGKWRVELNSEVLKKLSINPMYARLLPNRIDSGQDKYIQENLQSARWFIKSLNNRYDTLMRVASTIVSRQEDFLEHGDKGMKPMVLNDIAAELGLHESTISRATSGKYLLTPRGVYELKYFFTSSINNADGGTSSSAVIRSLIRKMIENEPTKKPISDNKLATCLEEQGYQVARRTVAKNREAMNIPASSQRKGIL